MKHEIIEKPDARVVVFSGEIDLESSPIAREILIKSFRNTKKVIVDLSEVSYIDSSGVASLVEAFQSAKSKGLKFALAQVSETPMRVLKLARLDQVFVIYATLDEATAALA